jgi:hypothetical protein
MILRILSALLLLAPSLSLALEAPSPSTISWTAQTVTLEVRAPTGMKKYTDIPWTLDMTVLDAMKVVDNLQITAEWYRSFGDWLITSLDKVPNQGSGKPNWQYCVNGTAAAVGVGSYVLGPKANVVWVFDSNYPALC